LDIAVQKLSNLIDAAQKDNFACKRGYLKRDILGKPWTWVMRSVATRSIAIDPRELVLAGLSSKNRPFWRYATRNDFRGE